MYVFLYSPVYHRVADDWIKTQNKHQQSAKDMRIMNLEAKYNPKVLNKSPAQYIIWTTSSPSKLDLKGYRLVF